MGLDEVALASLLLVVAAVFIVGFIGYKVKGWMEKDAASHKE